MKKQCFTAYSLIVVKLELYYILYSCPAVGVILEILHWLFTIV